MNETREVLADSLIADAKSLASNLPVGDGHANYIPEPTLPLLNRMLKVAVDLADALDDDDQAAESIRASIAFLVGRYGPHPYRGAHVPRERVKYDLCLDLIAAAKTAKGSDVLVPAGV